MARLEAVQPVLGHLPQEWQEMGVSPADLQLEGDEWYREVIESSRTEDLTAEQALERWPVGEWIGLAIDYELAPGSAGFPAIYGACGWRIWCGTDNAWRHSATIEYPMSSVGADARWPAWLSAFVAEAERLLGASCVVS